MQTRKFLSVSVGKLDFCARHNSRQSFTLPPLILESLIDKFGSLKEENVLKGIERNIRRRKGVGDVHKLLELKNLYDEEKDYQTKTLLRSQVIDQAKIIPNISHENVNKYGDVPFVLKSAKRFKPSFSSKDFSKIAKRLQLLRTDGLSALTGHKSYFFLEELANLENALTRFMVESVTRNGFSLVTVPDILPAEVIERCGMTTRGKRSQVYFLNNSHGNDLCLSGTAEMALAGMVAGKTFEENELPLRLAAVSRCYRSETSNVADERGIYRVHQFTKVEMFGVCSADDSEKLLKELLSLEESHFQSLGLDFQTLDMPNHELGAPAYRKHDIEAWFPGSKRFGELSSCSDCTDYQARRLQIKVNHNGKEEFAHTVNGTACAVPRTVMALIETHQKEDGTVAIPEALRPYFGRDFIGEPSSSKQKS